MTTQYCCERCKVHVRPLDEAAYSLDGVSWTAEVPETACNWHRLGTTFDYQLITDDNERSLPPIEDTLTPGVAPLRQTLIRAATYEWQKAEIWFKKQNSGDADVLLVETVRIIPPGDTNFKSCNNEFSTNFSERKLNEEK